MTETDIVELVKARNRIEDVIEADGFRLASRMGRYRKGADHDSLVVDVNNQAYFWNSQGESGDVIAWTMTRQKLDFKGAVEQLCQRAHLPMPEWSGESQVARAAARAREDAMGVAASVFVRWLWADVEAIRYARGRGWSDETIRGAMLGYSGKVGDRKQLAEELRRAMAASGVDGFGPAAVALCGYQGDVMSWGREHQVQVRQDWVDQGWVPGLVGRDMLLYAHLQGGRVRYYSGRGVHEKQHYNLPVELVGARQPYFNSVWAPSEAEVVIVEGQADALSLGQWGLAGVALSGVSMDEDMVNQMAGHQRRFMGLDADKAGDLTNYLNRTLKGSKAAGPLKGMLALGPMTRLVRWDTAGSTDVERSYIKDANDVLKLMAFPMEGKPAVESDAQRAMVERVINGAKTLAEEVSSWAGVQEGAKKAPAAQFAVEVISKLNREDLAFLQSDLVKALKLNSRDFQRMLKAATAPDKDEAGGEPVFTWGGCIKDWLVEYLYDVETGKAGLAWRDPDGKISSGGEVIIDGQRYLPSPPNEVLANSAIVFPSALGEKRSIKELVAYLGGYLKSIYLLPSERIGKLLAYWILSTWIYDAFETVMYLRAIGGAGSGKSELMKRIGMVCYRTMTASGAASTSSLFRSLERYKGTVFIDEADIQNSDTEADMVKFYNSGAMRNNPIWRTVEVVNQNGDRDWEAVSFQTFCPKLIAMRKEFRDDAIGSRSLTLKLVSKEMIELKAAGVPLTVNNQIRGRAQALRNLLCRWRMETWQEEIEVDPEFYDMTISPRLNQVAGPLLAVSRDDLEQQDDIRKTLRDYYAETILNQSMTIGARVLEAMWKIWNYPDLHKQLIKTDSDGSSLLKIGDITKITNEIIAEMNDEKEDDDEKDRHSSNRELKAQRVGRIIREEYQMQVTERRRDGFWVFWNEPRMLGLSNKYGIKPEDFGPKPGEEKAVAAAPAPKPVQERLA